MRALPLVALAALLAMACPAAAAADSDAGTPLVEVTAAAASLPSGDLGTLSMPALALPAPRQLSVGLGLDYFRGGNFLLPGATVQRSAMSLGLAYAPLPWLEAYGALAFSAANRFGDPVDKRSAAASMGGAGQRRSRCACDQRAGRDQPP